MTRSFFHLWTLNCTLTIHNDPGLMDTRQSFRQDCLPSQLQLTTLHQTSAVTHSASLSAWPSLPVYSNGKLLKCSHVCAQLPDFALCSTTPTGYILEAPEFGTPCCNLLVLVVSAIKGFQCTHMQIQVAENFHGLLSMNAIQHSPCKNTNCMVH